MDLYVRVKNIKFLEENIGVNLEYLGLWMIPFLGIIPKAQATKTDNKKWWQGCRKTAYLIHHWWEYKIVQ